MVAEWMCGCIPDVSCGRRPGSRPRSRARRVPRLPCGQDQGRPCQVGWRDDRARAVPRTSGPMPKDGPMTRRPGLSSECHAAHGSFLVAVGAAPQEGCPAGCVTRRSGRSRTRLVAPPRLDEPRQARPAVRRQPGGTLLDSRAPRGPALPAREVVELAPVRVLVLLERWWFEPFVNRLGVDVRESSVQHELAERVRLTSAPYYQRQPPWTVDLARAGGGRPVAIARGERDGAIQLCRAVRGHRARWDGPSLRAGQSP